MSNSASTSDNGDWFQNVSGSSVGSAARSFLTINFTKEKKNESVVSFQFRKYLLKKKFLKSLAKSSQVRRCSSNGQPKLPNFLILPSGPQKVGTKIEMMTEKTLFLVKNDRVFRLFDFKFVPLGMKNLPKLRKISSSKLPRIRWIFQRIFFYLLVFIRFEFGAYFWQIYNICSSSDKLFFGWSFLPSLSCSRNLSLDFRFTVILMSCFMLLSLFPYDRIQKHKSFIAG